MICFLLAKICVAQLRAFFALFICITAANAQPIQFVQGWNILSNDSSGAMQTIAAAKNYQINHLQLSHQVIMDLRQIKEPATKKLVHQLTNKAKAAGINEVLVWDHALYKLDYYPAEFKRNEDGKINLDNPAFWNWFKQDYREMIAMAGNIDGLVLTFIETGARAENQYSQLKLSNAEKLAMVVDAVADVVCNELNKKLYIRTFGYTEAEYKNTIGCISYIKNEKVRLMMKETPHDFFLTHPNDFFAGTINRPTIIEFDCGNEFNGQGIIANTWPGYIIKRWSHFINQPNIIGYVARTDRYNESHIVNTPNEILLYSLHRFTQNSKLTEDDMYDEFITKKYGAASLAFLKPAFKRAFSIVTGSLYTLGLNIANHSRMDFDPYKSSYIRHVSGKWLSPPVIKIDHGINRTFHYWKDIIEHLSPSKFKTATALSTDAPFVLAGNWVTAEEKMNPRYLRYILQQKKYAVKEAKEALAFIEKAKPVLGMKEFEMLYGLFYRTLLTAQLYKTTAVAYFGYRVYARGGKYQTKQVNRLIRSNLSLLLKVCEEIDRFHYNFPKAEWEWGKDTFMARKYYHLITEGWEEYGSIKIK